MATQAPTAPTKKKAPKPAEQQPQQPPDESIWTRYSPHGEAPLSGAGSFATHALAIGLIIILGKYVFDQNKTKNLPVEAVELSGGGRGAGRGIGDFIGDGSDREDGAGHGDGSVVEGPPEEGRLSLKPEEMQALAAEFKNDPDAMRAIQKGDANARAFASMSESARNKLRMGLNPGGKGGTADGGIAGGNSGDGTGGKGGRPLNEREKRMFRWAIDFGQGRSPADYLAQLQSMGAFLGVPDKFDPKHKEWTYKFIHDLHRGQAKMDDDDPNAARLIRWYNNDGRWSQAIMRELGVKAEPDHFVVYFPLELEQQFADEEDRYLKAHRLELRRIERTYFRLDYRNKRYVPVASSHELKPGR
jgi:hypothetical protein